MSKPFDDRGCLAQHGAFFGSELAQPLGEPRVAAPAVGGDGRPSGVGEGHDDLAPVGLVPAAHATDPTGVGDGFRAGFLAATSWGLSMERAAQVGAGIATLVLEADGPQEYAVRPDQFTDRLRSVYGAQAAAEIRAQLPG